MPDIVDEVDEVMIGWLSKSRTVLLFYLFFVYKS